VRLAIISTARTVLRDQLVFRSCRRVPARSSQGPGGRYLGGNTGFERFIGLNRQDFIGKNVYEVAKKELADLRAADRALFDSPGTGLARDPPARPHRARRGDAKATSRADGFGSGGLVVILDITERKRMEAALRDGSFRAFAGHLRLALGDRRRPRFTGVGDPARVGLAHPAGFIAARGIGDNGPTPARWRRTRPNSRRGGRSAISASSGSADGTSTTSVSAPSDLRRGRHVPRLSRQRARHHGTGQPGRPDRAKEEAETAAAPSRVPGPYEPRAAHAAQRRARLLEVIRDGWSGRSSCATATMPATSTAHAEPSS
jgi:hypothetical protein